MTSRPHWGSKLDRITCPVCGRTSYHPEDVRQGYCGFCHDFTSAPAYQRKSGL